jgi:type IV secretion system protein VirB6
MTERVSPISLIEPTIDKILSTYVSGVSASFSAALGVMVVSAITLQFTLLGLQIARGEVQEPLTKMVSDAIGMIFMATVALGAGIYQTQIVGLANGLLQFLVSVVSNGDVRTVGDAVGRIFTTDAGSVTVNGQAIAIPDALWTIAQQNSNALGIPDFTYMIASFFIELAIMTVSALCLLPWILSKVAIAIGLAIGPLFIVLGMWPLTRNYFASWLSFLIGNILTGMLVALVCSLIAIAFKQILVEAMIGVGLPDYNALKSSVAILVIGIALGFTALHLSQMGSQLAGGGVALNSGGVAGVFIQRFLQKSTKDPAASGPNSIKPSSVLSRASEPVGRQTGKRVAQVVDAVKTRGGSD